MKHNTLVPIFIILFLSVANVLYAHENDSLQRFWTLEECINYALKNNIELKLEKISLEEKKISFSDSKLAFAPNLSANTSYNLSFGRVLDETTYEFVTNQVMRSSNSSISANILLFDGLKKIRQLQYAKLSKDAAVLQYRMAENNLHLNITAFFLETLCAKENIKNCKSIVASLEEQEKLISIRVRHGKVTTAELLQIQSKLAEAENTLLSAEHSYNLSRINICQLLELEDYKLFEPVVNREDSIYYSVDNYVDILSKINSLPEIILAQKNIELAKKNVQISRAQYYPTLSLSLGYGTSFSSARQKMVQNENGSYTYSSYPFGEQYKDNASKYISLGLSIPIFIGSTVNNAKKAKLELKRNEYDLYTAKKHIEKELTQAIMDAETSWKKLVGSKKYLSFAQETARQITLKFEAGNVGVIEYNDVISSLIEAQTQFLAAKYEYIFKTKVLSLYQNEFLF